MSQALILPHLRDWARRVIPKVARHAKASAPARPRARRALLIHLDGVSRAVLQRAIDEGEVPFLASLVRSGSYQLDSAFWGAPPSTPVFEASLLYGARHPDIPAYSWFDRADRRVVRMNAPRDALDVEARLRHGGANLLEDGGTAYLTLFRGEAENRLCMSAMSDLSAPYRELRSGLGGMVSAARRGPWAHGAALLGEALHAVTDGARWGLRLFDWRHERELALMRVFLLHVLAGLVRSRAVLDMVSGAPIIYLVEAGFDEISHRRGPDSPQARRELRRIDHALSSLHAIARSLELPYDFHVFSDHGQSSSTPYESLAHRTLEQSLRLPSAEPLDPVLRSGLLSGRPPPRPGAGKASSTVIEVGSAAHLYLGRADRPLEARELVGDHGPLLGRLANDPRVGLFAVRRGDGAVAVSRHGVFSAEELSASALPPEYSVRAVAELLRELPMMPNAGDVVVLGGSDGKGGTIGFSWEFGSHGGVTRAETDSFVLWPTSGPVPLDGLGHASELNGRLLGAYRA